MLAITRRPGEGFKVGEYTHVRVSAVLQDRVRFHVQDPDGIGVLRYQGEHFSVLRGTVRIYITGIRRNQVRIGIVAPQEVKILRDELLERPPPVPVD
jgi:sRNA-binding carbon storage regulator CsrA